MQMYCTDQRKAAWFESDFCEAVIHPLTMDHFSKIKKSDKSKILPKYHLCNHTFSKHHSEVFLRSEAFFNTKIILIINALLFIKYIV